MKTGFNSKIELLKKTRKGMMLGMKLSETSKSSRGKPANRKNNVESRGSGLEGNVEERDRNTEEVTKEKQTIQRQ